VEEKRQGKTKKLLVVPPPLEVGWGWWYIITLGSEMVMMMQLAGRIGGVVGGCVGDDCRLVAAVAA